MGNAGELDVRREGSNGRRTLREKEGEENIFATVNTQYTFDRLIDRYNTRYCIGPKKPKTPRESRPRLEIPERAIKIQLNRYKSRHTYKV